MHFVEDDQLVFVVSQIEFRDSEFRPVRVGFKIEIDGRQTFRYVEGKRRFANLAWSK